MAGSWKSCSQLTRGQITWPWLPNARCHVRDLWNGAMHMQYIYIDSRASTWCTRPSDRLQTQMEEDASVSKTTIWGVPKHFILTLTVKTTSCYFKHLQAGLCCSEWASIQVKRCEISTMFQALYWSDQRRYQDVLHVVINIMLQKSSVRVRLIQPRLCIRGHQCPNSPGASWPLPPPYWRWCLVKKHYRLRRGEIKQKIYAVGC